ncbi:hypothetical protein TIFTF001_033735 [Ficus carica]|uniref:Apple domain-containing protein n=1 Tax=Ficus carica TaxID=3494 RepID=A0AA88J7Z6_FICCA|nr:hypothetical protein TIFTF001_033735 [Ficus carica]
MDISGQIKGFNWQLGYKSHNFDPDQYNNAIFMLTVVHKVAAVKAHCSSVVVYWGDCEASCLNNCSCTAYAYDSRGCSIWTGNLLYLKLLPTYNSNGRTLYLRLAASEIKKQSSVKGKFYIFLFWIITVAVVIPCAACSVYYLRRKKLVSKQGISGSTLGNPAISLCCSEKHERDFLLSGQFREDEKKGIEVPFVVLEIIVAATDNFSEANKLGQGVFGPVYKGKFPGVQ